MGCVSSKNKKGIKLVTLTTKSDEIYDDETLEDEYFSSVSIKDGFSTSNTTFNIIHQYCDIPSKSFTIIPDSLIINNDINNNFEENSQDLSAVFDMSTSFSYRNQNIFEEEEDFMPAITDDSDSSMYVMYDADSSSSSGQHSPPPTISSKRIFSATFCCISKMKHKKKNKRIMIINEHCRSQLSTLSSSSSDLVASIPSRSVSPISISASASDTSLIIPSSAITLHHFMSAYHSRVFYHILHFLLEEDYCNLYETSVCFRDELKTLKYNNTIKEERREEEAFAKENHLTDIVIPSCYESDNLLTNIVNTSDSVIVDNSDGELFSHSSHSSILEDEESYPPGTSPGGSNVFFLKSAESSSFILRDSQIVMKCNNWLVCPYQTIEQIFLKDLLFDDNIPSSDTAFITPSHMVLRHHQRPQQTSLHLPRLQYPGTCSAISCFTSLQHIAIGCIGFEPDLTVTDYDISVLVQTLGKNLKSIRLMKLNGITSSSIAMITSNCSNIDVLVVFGCEGMRIEERNKQIQKVFDSHSEERSPTVFLSDNKSKSNFSLGNYKINYNDNSNSNTTNESAEKVRRRISLLDVRYSIDLNDDLLVEIMNAYEKIEIFLGSNIAVTSITTNSKKFKPDISYECWAVFENYYESSCSQILYIDDAMREQNKRISLQFIAKEILYNCRGSLSPNRRQENSHTLFDIDAILQTIPILLDPEMFNNMSNSVPGSE